MRAQPADGVLFGVLLALLVWLPLPLGSDRPWAQGIFNLCAYSISVCWLILFLGGKVACSQALRGACIILVLFGLWLGLVGLQLYAGAGGTRVWGLPFISLDPHLTGEKLLLSISLVLLFFLTLALVTSRKRLKSLILTVVCCGLFQAVYGSVMTLSGLEYHFFMKKWSYIGVATGTFINRNHLAAFLVMCLAVGIGLMIAQPGGGKNQTLKQRFISVLRLLLGAKARLRLCLVIMVIALVLTQSRMGNIAFVLSVFIAGLAALILSRSANRRFVALLVSLVLIDVLLVGAWFGLDKVAERLQATSLASEARIDVYVHVLELWRDYRFTGAGLGAFPTVFPQYRVSTISGFYQHTHNDYLQFAAETGLAGLAILGLVVLLSLGSAFRALHVRRDPLLRGTAFAAILGIVAMMIHATVEFNFQIPANAAYFIVLLSLAWISFHLESGNKARQASVRVGAGPAAHDGKQHDFQVQQQ